MNPEDLPDLSKPKFSKSNRGKTTKNLEIGALIPLLLPLKPPLLALKRALRRIPWIRFIFQIRDAEPRLAPTFSLANFRMLHSAGSWS